jgi:chromosome segregation ATPase
VTVIERETIQRDLPDDIKLSLYQLHAEVKRLWGEVHDLRSRPAPQDRVIERYLESPPPSAASAPSDRPSPPPPPSSPRPAESSSGASGILRELSERVRSVESSLSEFGDFTNSLHQQLERQSEALKRLDTTTASALEAASAARSLAEKQSATINDLFTPPRTPDPEPEQELEPESELAPQPGSEPGAAPAPAPAPHPRTVDEVPSGDTTPVTSARSVRAEVTAPRPASVNTDELLDSFLDVARSEVDVARRGILDETRAELRALSSQLAGQISKGSASTDLQFKKIAGRLQEQETGLQTQLAAARGEQSAALTQASKSAAELLGRVRTIEQRIEALAAAPKETPKMENIVGADGKVDLEPVLIGLQEQMRATLDLTGRVRAVEEREVVAPAEMKGVAALIAGHDEKLNGFEVRVVAIELRIAELRELLEDLRKGQRNPEDDAKYLELRDHTRALQEESAKVRDTMVKVNKDVISCRAAINTLRAHSEEAAAAMDDVRRVSESVRDDVAGTDKRLKKIVVFVQNETKELAGQIKDLQASLDRNANRVEEVAAQRQVERVVVEAAAAPAQAQPQAERPAERPADRPSDRPADRDKPVSPKPHAPLPPLAPLPQAPPPPAAPPLATMQTSPHPQEYAPPQVVTLPPQIIYEQPVIVKKTIEVEAMTMAKPKPIARTKTPAAREPTKTLPPEVSRADLRRYDELFGRIEKVEQGNAAIRAAIETVANVAKGLQDTKADKEALQGLFDQFRMAMGELNNRVGALRKAVMQKADVSELAALRADVTKDLHQLGETAAGTEAVRCLLCGNPKHNVAQAIPHDDAPPRPYGGPGLSSRIQGVDGNGASCFVYSETGEMFLGRSADGKPIILKNLLGQPQPQPLAARPATTEPHAQAD